MFLYSIEPALELKLVSPKFNMSAAQCSRLFKSQKNREWIRRRNAELDYVLLSIIVSLTCFVMIYNWVNKGCASQHLRKIPLRISDSRTSNMTWMPTNSTHVALTRKNNPVVLSDE